MSKSRGPKHERLIPVAPSTTREAPTLEWLRAKAAYLTTHREKMLQELRAKDRERPAGIAERDQAHAAEDESIANMHEHAASTEFSSIKAGMAARLGVTMAMFRRTEARCRHIEWPPPADSPKVAVLLEFRVAICGRAGCETAANHRWHDDGRCEICERPSERFTPHATALGPCVVSFHACDECTAMFKESLHS